MTLRSWVLWFSICFNTPRLWRAFLFITMAWAATACVREPNTRISTWSPELLEYCEDASDRWYDATGILVECIHGSRDDAFALRWGDPGGCAAGRTGPGEILVRLEPEPACGDSAVANPGWPDAIQAYSRSELLSTVVMHEVGHAIAGGGHGHAEGGIMFRKPLPGDPIDRATLDWLCASADCVWEEAE